MGSTPSPPPRPGRHQHSKPTGRRMGRTILARRRLRHSRRDRKGGRCCNAYSIPTSASAAEAQTIRIRPRGAALGANLSPSELYVCVCLFCDRRGAWWTRSRGACFFVTLSTSTSNHQPFTGLVGAAWRGAGCIAIVVDVNADMDASLKSDVFADWHYSFPFRSLFSAHFFSAHSAPPPHPPNFWPSNEQCHALILLTR